MNCLQFKKLQRNALSTWMWDWLHATSHMAQAAFSYSRFTRICGIPDERDMILGLSSPLRQMQPEPVQWAIFGQDNKFKFKKFQLTQREGSQQRRFAGKGWLTRDKLTVPTDSARSLARVKWSERMLLLKTSGEKSYKTLRFFCTLYSAHADIPRKIPIKFKPTHKINY